MCKTSVGKSTFVNENKRISGSYKLHCDKLLPTNSLYVIKKFSVSDLWILTKIYFLNFVGLRKVEMAAPINIYKGRLTSGDRLCNFTHWDGGLKHVSLCSFS